MKHYESVNEIDLTCDLWQRLAGAEKPIVLYGMGNGADKILAVFAQYGIEAADFFASDEFVRGQSFHGKTVLTYAQVCEKYEDFIIAVSFGSRLPEVLERIYALDGERELVIPDVPVVEDGEIFDLAFFEAHRTELAEVCDMLADIQSKRTFCDIIAYRLTGKLGYLRSHIVTPDEVYNDILHADRITRAADLGAYNGDSIRELAHYAPNLTQVTAMEPDVRTFRKLNEFIAGGIPYAVEAHNLAAWNDECELSFTAGGNRNSTAASNEALKTGAKIKIVQAARLDSIYEGDCDYIKYDVEGSEREALEGSRAVIARTHPRLLVSLYHRSGDLFRLPQMVRELGYTKLYIRRYEYVPAWDLNLLAVE
ncbi:MAG: FkbM family methyltransferase [Clostridia bacterium]|nr:FkbM family methyltransferase [Clostridia bacterium]